MALTEDDLRRLRVHLAMRQLRAHLAIAELVSAASLSGLLGVGGDDAREQRREVGRRRDVLEDIIFDVWERMKRAEARVAELSQVPDGQEQSSTR